jgi:hypothetical protein
LGAGDEQLVRHFPSAWFCAKLKQLGPRTALPWPLAPVHNWSGLIRALARASILRASASRFILCRSAA